MRFKKSSGNLYIIAFYVLTNLTSWKKQFDFHNKYNEDDTIKMLDFLFDNILVEFGMPILRRTSGFPMSTNCASLAAVLFLYLKKAKSPRTWIKNQQFAYFYYYSFRISILKMFCHSIFQFAFFSNIVVILRLKQISISECLFQIFFCDIDTNWLHETRTYDKRGDFRFKH